MPVDTPGDGLHFPARPRAAEVFRGSGRPCRRGVPGSYLQVGLARLGDGLSSGSWVQREKQKNNGNHEKSRSGQGLSSQKSGVVPGNSTKPVVVGPEESSTLRPEGTSVAKASILEGGMKVQPSLT